MKKLLSICFDTVIVFKTSTYGLDGGIGISVISHIFCDFSAINKFCRSELRHDFRILKSLAKIFQARRLQSVSILSILNHPCSLMVYYYLFGVFLC